MYRILEEHDEVREWQNQLSHPSYQKPELLVETSNKIWSWGITKFRGPVKWTHYYLYVILDFFSQYVVGWMAANRETASLATRLIVQSCEKHVNQKAQSHARYRDYAQANKEDAMAIDFSLSDEQKLIQASARKFAQNDLKPVTTAADKLDDPWECFVATSEVYKKAYDLGFAMGFIPKEYGGAGISNVDLQIVAEEICTVDPGFGCTLLVNGLALLPILWFGNTEQRSTWLTRATSDPSRSFIAGWVVSEPGGTANFDSERRFPAGLQTTATYDRSNGEFILNGRKMWNTNACGWDKQGADVNVVVARLSRQTDGTQGAAAFIVPRGTKGITTTGILNTLGHRTSVQPEILFEDCRIPEANLLPGSLGNGELVVTKAFTWSGPVAAIAAVGVMRAAFDFALQWSKDYVAGGSAPIIHHQNVGYMLSNLKMKIEAARYLSWKAAHYLDTHDCEGQEGGALAKIFAGELAVQGVIEAMQLVGINSYLLDYPLQRNIRDALCFPIYDAGNMGMQRRRLHGIIADPHYDPLAFSSNLGFLFHKKMLGYDSNPGHPVSKSGHRIFATHSEEDRSVDQSNEII